MAELLILNKNNTHSDPDKNIEEVYKRGDIIHIAEDGWGWGAGETLPDFVVVKVPGLAVSTIIDRMDDWTLGSLFSIFSTNAAADSAVIDLSITNPGTEYGITRAQVENYLNNWNAIVNSSGTNTVRFTVTIADLFTSQNLWGVNPVSLGLTITETDYQQAGGIHTAEVNAAGASITTQQVEEAANKVDPLSVSTQGQKVTVVYERTAIRDVVFDLVRERINRMVRRRQYHFADSDVDLAVNAGGEITITTTQLNNKVLNKAA